MIAPVPLVVDVSLTRSAKTNATFYAPNAVIANDETETVWPLAIEVLERFRSDPEVPHKPCTTQVVPAEEVHKRQYPAVPVAAAVAEVIEPAVRTPVVDVPNVAEHGSDASSVPVAAAAQFEGTVPV